MQPSNTTWVEMVSVVEPQINAEGIHNYPFDSSFPIDVRYFTSNGRYKKRMNRHRYLEVFHVTAGDTSVQVQDRVLTACEGDLVVIGSFVYHRVLGSRESQSQFTLLFFEPELINCGRAEDAEYLLPFFGQNVSFPHVIPACTGIPEEVLGLMRRIQAELPAASVLARLGVKTYLKMILILLAKHYAELGVRQDIDRRRRELERLGALFKFLDEHCEEPLLVKDAARLAAMSPSHFMGFFKRATGQSFVAYVNHFRIARAQELLTTSDKPISDISRAVGFCNHSYFGMVFRQTVGTTPLAYRRNCRRLPNIQQPVSSVLHMDAELSFSNLGSLNAQR
jgi:AraC family transcriptional regulator, transcriptional activator of pobA